MPITKWILPEGIEDILPEQAYWLEMKRREVVDTFLFYGYGLVIPPLIEYSDSLLNNISEDLNLQTFKLTDQETGKQLGLRADITSQISRIYSTYNNEGTNRYCYFDHVVRTKNRDSKKSRTPIQVGAELIGSNSVIEDAELINLMLDTLKKFTSKKIFLDIGHVGIFKKLMSFAKLEIEQEKQIKKLIRSKSTSEIKKYLSDLGIDSTLKECIGNFPKMHGSIKNIAKHAEQLNFFNNNIEDDINRMIGISDIVSKSHNDVEIKYDFCELNGFDYENNIIFSAYIENDSVAASIGGRYDCDKEGISGIGFSMDVRHLLKYQTAETRIVNQSGKWVLEVCDE